MQASHGFMATSPHAKNLGAFINLESTGPWGPDVVFQHTGDWTLGAYARAAPYPRGTTVAQDFFELGVIPADTDYRMFSYRHHGSIPGIDVAFLFDGTAYHTARDETSRIRPGTLQGMGENMLATVLEFCRELAHHAHGRMDADGNVTVAERYYAPDQPGGLVFFDVLSTFMVVYDHKAAALLHSLPLAVLLTLSLVSLATQASGHKDTLWQRVPPPGALLGLAGQALLTFLSALVVPMALGAAKALATGAPMSWYGRPLAAYTTFLPAAAAGALLPQLSSGPVTPSSARSRSLGFALLFAAAATALTACNFRSSYGLAIWAAGAIAAAVLAPGPSSSTAWTWRSAFGVATCMATPILITLPTAMSIADHIMEKIGLAGSVPGPFGVAVPDTIVGTLTGTAIFLAGGAALPYIAAGLGKHARAVVAVLIALSLAAAAREVPLWRSSPGSTMQTFHPYSHRHPKRIIMQHIHRHTPQGQVVSSLYSFSSLDAVPVEVALPRAVLSLPHAEFDRHDWEALYPLNYLVTGAARVAPPPAPGTRTPSLKGTKGRTLWQRVLERFGARPGEENAPAAGLSRWYFELDTARPAWAVLNITGEVAAWSLGPEVATKQLANVSAFRVFRELSHNSCAIMILIIASLCRVAGQLLRGATG